MKAGQKMDFVRLKSTTARERIREYESLYRVDRPTEERPPHRHVEETFDAFVKDFGGAKISERIQNKSQMPNNADYIFDKYNVIAELKTLEGVFAGPESLKLLQQAFIDAGVLDFDVLDVIFGSESVPEEVAKLISRRMRRSIEQRIKIARKQLRQSKASFGDEGTHTLIIFAMDKTPLFGHHTMILNLARLMSDNYADKHTDGIIYMNPNTPTKVREDGMEFSGWYPFYRDDDVNKKLSGFVNVLGNRWLNYCSIKNNSTNPILELSSTEDMLEVLRPYRLDE